MKRYPTQLEAKSAREEFMLNMDKSFDGTLSWVEISSIIKVLDPIDFYWTYNGEKHININR